ncbi:MAG TPA: hypothetical protein VK308_00440 [Pyrinomonadaceae bacterium]|nr:hypothetical protein [Pyrinomonadaceae bacterium]
MAGNNNSGEPTKQSWLMGVWKLNKIGTAVDYTKKLINFGIRELFSENTDIRLSAIY